MSNEEKSELELKDTSDNDETTSITNTKSIVNKEASVEKRIARIRKLFFSVIFVFGIISIFTFSATYMMHNDFFSYEIFSIKYIWLFALSGLFAFLFLVTLYGSTIAYIYYDIFDKNNAYRKLYIFFTWLIIFFFIVIIWVNHASIYYRFIIYNTIMTFLIFIFTRLDNKLLLLYKKVNFLIEKYTKIYDLVISILFVLSIISCCYFISYRCCTTVIVLICFLFIVIIIIILYYIKSFLKKYIKELIKTEEDKKIGFISVICSLIFFIYIVILAFSPDIYTKAYDKLFKFMGLASDHAEIYLKDKNESVISGKLIFDDGKYAYVEFDRTYSNCIDIGDSCIKTIRRKVPSEDVSIVTKVKKDTKASVPK